MIARGPAMGKWAIVALYLMLALAYGIVNPAFESPDEIYHFDYVEQLLRTRRLPVAELGQSEYHQPPLYYLAGAVLTAWLPAGSPMPAVMAQNPYWAWNMGQTGVDNKSQFLHGPEQSFPWHGPWLRLHLLRAFSALLGLIVVLSAGEFALMAWPGRHDVSLLAMAAVAFLPQFLFLAGSFSNDIAAAAAAAVVLVLVGRLLTRARHRLRTSLFLGLALGCAVLVKMNMLILVAIVAGVLACDALLPGRRQSARAGARAAWAPLAGVCALPLAVAGPYLWRNWLVYGDPTALSRMDALWGKHDPALTWRETLPLLPNIWTSFWGRFAYGQIPVSNILYRLCAYAVLLAAAGLALLLLRSARRRAGPAFALRGDGRPLSERRFMLWALAGLMLVAFTAATVRYSQTSLFGAFGRFIFPALPGAALFLAAGWTEIGRRARLPSWCVPAAFGAALLAFSAWSLFGVLRPAYILPTQPASTAIQAPGLRLGDAAVLRGVRLGNLALAPGGAALLEVEWQPMQRTERPLTLVMHLLGPDNEVLGQRYSYPGMGRTSTTYWEPGRVFTDRYQIPIDPAIGRSIAPAQVRVELFFFDAAAQERLPVVEEATGRRLDPPIVAEGKLPPPKNGAASGAPQATFGQSLGLLSATFPASARPGSSVDVNLAWEALGPLPDGYNLFVHLVPAGQAAPVAQADGPVLGGRYPGRLWTAGERFDDLHPMSLPAGLPAGAYRLLIGLYRLDTGERLPVRAAGRDSADGYEIGRLVVTD